MKSKLFTKSNILLIVMAFFLFSMPLIYRFVDEYMKKNDCLDDGKTRNSILNICETKK